MKIRKIIFVFFVFLILIQILPLKITMAAPNDSYQVWTRQGGNTDTNTIRVEGSGVINRVIVRRTSGTTSTYNLGTQSLPWSTSTSWQYVSNVTVYYDHTNIPNITFAGGTVGTTKVSTYNMTSKYEALPPQPSVPTGLVGESDVRKINLSWNPSQNADGYYIYRNGNKIGETTALNYTDENLEIDVFYSYQVSSYNQHYESSKSSSVSLMSMSEIIEPVLSFINLTDRSVRLQWNQSGMDYRIYRNDEYLRTVPGTWTDIQSLEADTDYDFYIIARDKYYRENQSNIVSFRTMKHQLQVPHVSINQVTYNSFRLYWTNVPNVDEYRVYMNSELVTTTMNTEYIFTDLEPDTIYNLRLTAANEDDEKTVNVSQRTNRLPVPTVSSVSVAPSMTPDGTQRELMYIANDLVTEVAVYINGELLGFYSVEENTIMLDFESYEDSIVNIRVEPTDENGVGTSISTPTKSLGNESVDLIMPYIMNILSILIKAFVWLAIMSLPLFIVVMAFFWTRRKQKGILAKTENEKQPFHESNQQTHIEKNNILVDRRRPRAPPRSRYEKMGYQVTGSKMVNQGGLFRVEPVEMLTYEKNGIVYEEKFIRTGKGRYTRKKKVVVPKGFDNKVKHFQHTFKSAFGNIKKSNNIGGN